MELIITQRVNDKGVFNPSSKIAYKVTIRPVSKDNCAASAIFCAASPSSNDGLGAVPFVSALIKLVNCIR